MEERLSYIGFVRFASLHNWSVAHLTTHKFIFSKDFPLVRLGNFLRKSNQQLQIRDDQHYQRVTVRINNGGVTPRDIEIGSKIGTKRQFKVSPGQFIISKIDARNGAMGIIPESLRGAIVTNDFPTFDIDESKILPQFMLLVTTTKRFVDFAQGASSGTTNRQRVDLKRFLDVKIPLPDLGNKGTVERKPTQQSLVNDYNYSMQQAAKAEEKAANMHNEISRYLNEQLGIDNTPTVALKTGLAFVDFNALSRWDVPFLLNDATMLTSDYPLVNYGKLFKNLNNGIAARNYADKGLRFLKVSDIKANLIDDKNIKFIDTYRPNDVINANTLLITRKGTVGNSIFIKEDGKYSASSEVFIIKIDEERVDGDFLSEVNLSEFVQKQYREKNTGTIMASISQVKLLDIQIPLPDSLTVQQQIATNIGVLRREMTDQLTVAEQLREKAISDFESAIFD